MSPLACVGVHRVPVRECPVRHRDDGIHDQAPANGDAARMGGDRLAEKASLHDTSSAQIVQSIEREESNDGTHETKSALLRRRRMGPEPGQDFPGPEGRHVSSGFGKYRI